MTINFFEGSSSSYPARTANDVARQLIALSVSKSKDISLVYRELLRAVIFNFSQFAVIDEENKSIEVRCIHANPERAIAKLTQEDGVTLPLLSVHQPVSARDTKRQKYKPLVVAEKYWDEKKQRAIRLVSLVPSPIEIQYELNIWTKYKNDLDQLTEQIHSIFNPDLEIVTPFATNIKLFIQEEQVDPSFIVGDREDRVLRRTFKINASTYIPSPKFMLTSTGKIQEFNYEVEFTQETLSSYLNNFEDFMPDPNALFNASALFGYPVASGNPSAAGSFPALVWNGSAWSASDIFLELSAVPGMLFSASSLFSTPVAASVSGAVIYDVLTYNGAAWVPSTVTATGSFVSGQYAASAGTASALLGSSILSNNITSGASLVWNGQHWSASALYLRTSEVPNIVTNASALLGSGIVGTPVSGAGLTYNGSAWVASSVLLKVSDVTSIVTNASSLLGSAIAINPVLGAALTWNGNNWAASDTYVKVSDIAELTAKVASMDWGARYYRPDFVKLSYVSQFGTGQTGSEVEGAESSDLWSGTSAFGEISRWFIPELSFRNQGVIDIDITGYFDPSSATVANKTLFAQTSSQLSSLNFSGITIPASIAITSTGDFTPSPVDPNTASAARFVRIIAGTGAITPASYSSFSNLPMASGYLYGGRIRTATTTNHTLVIFPKDRSSSAVNANSYFTVSEKYNASSTIGRGTFPVSTLGDYYTPVSGSHFVPSTQGLDLVSSLIVRYSASPTVDAIMQASGTSYTLSAGDVFTFYRVASGPGLFDGTLITASSTASTIARIELPSDVADGATLSGIFNASTDFSTTMSLSAYVDSGTSKLQVRYMGATDGFEYGVVGTGARKLGFVPATGSDYIFAYESKQDTFDIYHEGGEYKSRLASAVAVFEIQVADDPYDDTLDYTDLPYGVEVSTLGYPVYDPSGVAYAGNVNTSTLYQITYQAPPSSVGLSGLGSITRGYPQAWTTVSTFETGVSSFANIYGNRNYFDLHVKLRSAGFEGSLFYQPYSIELNQVSGTEVFTKKAMNRTTIDVTKDKMMRVRFKCIQFRDDGTQIAFTDVPSPYFLGNRGKGAELVPVYYGVTPRVVTVTTLGATLSCPGDGHPF